MKLPLVSVIVTTRNNHATLELCLYSIKQQSYPAIELIVVDNNSTDDTKAIAQNYTEHVFNKGPERSTQRNFGVGKAKGEYVLIIDSDMELSEHVVAACVDKAVSEPKVKATIIPEESFGRGFWAQCKRLERSFYVGVDAIEAARFFEKKLYEEVGGYNEAMAGGEDWDLTRRVRKVADVARVTPFIAHNEGHPHFLRTVRKFYYYAHAASTFFANNPTSSALTDKSGPIERYKLFFSHPIKLFKNPVVGVGMLMLKTAEYGAAGIGYYKGKGQAVKQGRSSIARPQKSTTATKPLVSVVVPTFRRNEDLARLLQSLKGSDYPSELLEVIIVDNAADKELPSLVRAIFPKAKIIAPDHNLYSNGARRLGSKEAKGEYIFLLDDDNVLSSSCVALLVDVLENSPELGADGPLMLDGDSDTIWCAGARMNSFGLPQNIFQGSPKTMKLPKLIHDVDYFPNACMVRRRALESAPLDDKMFPHNWAESDFCLRILAAGYKIACVTAAVERHYIGYSGRLTRLGVDKTYDQAKSRVLFRRRHLPSLIDWLKFWLVIFPVSTTVYFLKIMQTSDTKTQLLRAYARGTFQGLTERLQEPPRS